MDKPFSEYIDVFPACAGMNRRRAERYQFADGVPRMRGDEPVWKRLRSAA